MGSGTYDSGGGGQVGKGLENVRVLIGIGKELLLKQDLTPLQAGHHGTLKKDAPVTTHPLVEDF